MSTGLRASIDAGDSEGLAALLAADAACAEADVRFGEREQHAVPALHYVCDAVFSGTLERARAAQLARQLLDAGVDVDRAYAKSGDTYLIAAASLGVEEVGLLLVERGARVEPRGLFGATALHWSAMMGLDRLAQALIGAGAELELRDRKYDCTPLEWTLHAWKEGGQGGQESLPRVAKVLRTHGATLPAEALASLQAERDAPMRAALTPEGPA